MFFGKPTPIDNGIPVTPWPDSNNTATVSEPQIDYDRPPGLIGDLADHILGAARKQVKEVALAGSIAYCASLFGRAYNVTGTGLNEYIILLTDSRWLYRLYTDLDEIYAQQDNTAAREKLFGVAPKAVRDQTRCGPPCATISRPIEAG